jgi:multidrug efflux pump subunit AcrB
MSLVELALKNRTVTLFAVFLLLVGGIGSFFTLGQLEDPDFTVKVAMIITQYPGASPQEVEQEVTGKIEAALQEMGQLDNMYSLSKAGLSLIRVEMNQEFWADRLPQVWDEMRRKVGDLQPQLPPGVLQSQVMDDFSFVYGFVLALTGDGYDYAELEAQAKSIKRDLSLVDGVARVELWGVQPKVIYLDMSQEKMSQIGITPEVLLATLAIQNMVVPAGGLEVEDQRFRVALPGDFQSPEDIGDLMVRRSILDIAGNVASGLSDRDLPTSRPTDLVALKDLADVRPGYLEPPLTLMRFNGQPAIGIALANVTGGNIVATGHNIDRALEEVVSRLPVGLALDRMAWQSDLVTTAINDFLINLAEAILIVVVVLALAMGWRMGVVIGSGLVLTILGTFIVMAILEIDLHRVSLGALIIALGMMVDNAIVVADGIYVRLKSGMDPEQAAIESASGPSIPLLGATFVAFMAFYPIYAAVGDTGEYAGNLFTVVGVSLLFSWVLSMTVTPIQCLQLLKVDKDEGGGEDEYSGALFDRFRGVLATALRFRVMTVGGLTLLLVISVVAFGLVEQEFFPDSTRMQFMIDYWAPEGTRIQTVAEDLKPIEERLVSDGRVANVSTFIGGGGPRFYLPVDPELPYPSFAQLVVNTNTLADVSSLATELEPWLNETFPQALTRVRKYIAGPGETWPLELRITGPADADPDKLREIADSGKRILEESGMAKHIRVDMRQRVRKIVLVLDQDRSRRAAVSRLDVARATLAAYDGLPVGLYREADDLYPIIIRTADQDRSRVAGELDVVPVRPALSINSLPLSEVTRDIEVEWEDPIIPHWNRRREIALQAMPDGVTFPTLIGEVADQLEALEIPVGYRLFWDGESKSTRESQEALVPGAIPTVVIVIFILVALFNSMRPAAIILLAIPFAVIGITWGLLLTNTAFSFMALLGAMSLAGMMIKNSIVLIDQIRLEIGAGRSPYQAIIDSAVSRLRPVVLAAATTVLGVAPLLQDVFWVSMAQTIMFGLAFGTVLTMVLVPVLYAMFYNVEQPA